MIQVQLLAQTGPSLTFLDHPAQGAGVFFYQYPSHQHAQHLPVLWVYLQELPYSLQDELEPRLEQLAAVLPAPFVVSVVVLGSVLVLSLSVVSFHWAAEDPGINKRFGVGAAGCGLFLSLLQLFPETVVQKNR